MRIFIWTIICLFSSCGWMLAESVLDGAVVRSLSNGVKVIVKENHELPLVSMQVWVKAGAVNENPRINGISHLMEHMMFKGTKSYSAGEIARTVESWGGSINAATSDEFTFYYIDIASEASGEALKILYEISSSPLFPETELEKEKSVIIEEISRKKDMPTAKLWDILRPELFSDSAYRYSVIGDSDVVKAITRRDLIEYFDLHYRAENMVVVCAGAVSAEDFFAQAEGYFKDIKSGAQRERIGLISAPKKSKLISKADNVKQIYFSGGFVGPDIDSPDQYPLDVLAVILGGGNSAKLRQYFYEDKEMVWSIGCSFYSNIGNGVFSVNAVVKKGREEEFASGLDGYFAGLSAKKIGKKEVRRAVILSETQMLLSSQTNNQAASMIGYYAVYGREEILRGYLDNLRRVKPKDVVRAAEKYLRPENFLKAVIYPND